MPTEMPMPCMGSWQCMYCTMAYYQNVYIFLWLMLQTTNEFCNNDYTVLANLGFYLVVYSLCKIT